MATKTISLKVQAWNRLRAARRRPDESFSEVVLRAEWPPSGGEIREPGAPYGEPLAGTGRRAFETPSARLADAPPVDLAGVVGTWVEDDEQEAILASFREVDAEAWR